MGNIRKRRMIDMMQLTKARSDSLSLIVECAKSGVLRKAVLSKPSDPNELKCEISRMKLGDTECFRSVYYMRDGKAIQKNVSDVEIDIIAEAIALHGQINILTTIGDAELRCSKSGKEKLFGDLKIRETLKKGVPDAQKLESASNDRVKKRMLSEIFANKV